MRKNTNRRETANKPSIDADLERQWFAQGKVVSAPWAIGSESVRVGDQTVTLRTLSYPKLYLGNEDTWLDVWAQAELRLRTGGEYRPPSDPLQVCVALDGSSIEKAGTLDDWPAIAPKLRPPVRVEYGLVAVGTPDVSLDLVPGVTLALESPMGGRFIAMSVVQDLAERGIGAVMGWTEGNGRWGLIRIIYAPRLYAIAGMEDAFGIHWRKWQDNPSDPLECKRVWCEHAALAVKEIVAGLPSLLIENISFDAYAATDRLGELSPIEILQLTKTPPEQLASELIRLNL